MSDIHILYFRVSNMMAFQLGCGSAVIEFPIVTLTGSLQQDLLCIDKVLGAGELALSDHRSSWPSQLEVTQLLSDARVGGMLSGKPGVIHFHMGSSPSET